MDVQRTIDQRYLTRNTKHEPRHYFDFVASAAAEHLSGFARPRVLEIGCATGDFLHFLSSRIACDLTGVDILPDLVDHARAEVPTARFLTGDVLDRQTLPRERFDAVFMLTIHSLFDDPAPWLDNIFDLLDLRGRAFVFGLFNPEDVDVVVRARYSGRVGPWEPGWNIFSRATLSELLDQRRAWHRFTDYSVPAVPRNSTDPLHSWTVELADGERLLLNGLQVIHRFALLEMAQTAPA